MKHAAIVSPLVAIALAAVLGATAPAAATEYVTRNCDGLPPECGQWHYNDTWDPSGIPGPGDTARLQLPVEVRLAADVTSLVLESGHQLVIGPASHPSANLNTWGVSDWQAGNITGNGSLRQWGILRVTGSSDRTCRARLENHGTVQVEMWFDVTLGDGGVDNTDPAGTIDLQTDADLLFYSAGDGLLNSGTIRKSGGAGVSEIGLPVSDFGGSVEVLSGTLAYVGQNSDWGGTCNWHVASGAVLKPVPPGAFGSTFHGNFVGSGGGLVVVDDGVFNAAGGVATLDFPHGMLQWSGGTFRGEIDNVGTLTLSGTGTRRLVYELYNSGEIRFESLGTLQMDGGSLGRLSNLPGAVFEIMDDAGFTSSDGTTGFHNFGMLRKSGGTGTASFAVDFSNEGGTVEVTSGALSFDRSGTSTGGHFVAAAGAEIVLVHTAGTIERRVAGILTGAGAGRVTIGGAAVAVLPAGATFDFPPGLLHFTGGRLRSDGSAATLTNAGAMTLSGGGGPLLAELTLRNAGEMLLVDDTTLYLGGGSYGRLDNLESGVIDLAGDSDLSGWGGTSGIVNDGLIVKSAGAGTSQVLTGVPLANASGTIEVLSGTLDLAGNLTQTSGILVVHPGATLAWSGTEDLGTGQLRGAGAVDGNVANGSGRVSPGPPVGELTITGSYAQSGDGVLFVELAGLAPGEYDVLEIGGAASLGGTLMVRAVDGFEPMLGDSWTILTAGSRSGEFDHVVGRSGSGCEIGFDVSYGASSVAITAVEAAGGLFCDGFEGGDTSAWSTTTR